MHILYQEQGIFPILLKKMVFGTVSAELFVPLYSMKINVIIPIYRATLPDMEAAALRNNAELLGRYDLTLLAPEGLDISAVEALAPAAKVMRVSDEWLGRKNGIAGYNRMMLSESFYRRFEAWDYILICHTDAWIFRDEVADWAARGYDCVAAPWLRRKVYTYPLVSTVFRIKEWWERRQGRRSRSLLYDKVGNGGLSLRRVKSCIEVCRREHARIGEYLSSRHHLCNEDVFWAEAHTGFRYPTAREALEFAFDTHPAYCYRLLGGRLPMGCHSWNKPRMYRFWRNFLHLE